jgi:RNA polymerase sigma-70 factor (ECF subfamily)
VSEAAEVVDRLFRRESGRAVATLIRVLGDFDLAEEAVQEAFAIALDRWPLDGIPDNPGAWITSTARNRAIDRIRREQQRPGRPKRRSGYATSKHWVTTCMITDDRLRPILPAVTPRSAGITGGAYARRWAACPRGIARAFISNETTIQQRLVRAKKKIRDAAIRTASRLASCCPSGSTAAGCVVPPLQRGLRRERGRRPRAHGAH